jgi:hypothetical protein
MTRRPTRPVAAAVLAGVLAACVGCSSVVAGTPSPADGSDAVTSAAGSETNADAGGTAGSPDPCALVTADELAPLVGDAKAQPTDASYTRICDWRGSSGSVEVVVGAVGSAPGDAVPDDPLLHPAPIGDGFSATSSGLVEFGAHERLVIVAVQVGGKGDRDRTLELARAVRGRL